MQQTCNISLFGMKFAHPLAMNMHVFPMLQPMLRASMLQPMRAEHSHSGDEQKMSQARLPISHEQPAAQPFGSVAATLHSPLGARSEGSCSASTAINGCTDRVLFDSSEPAGHVGHNYKGHKYIGP